MNINRIPRKAWIFAGLTFIVFVSWTGAFLLPVASLMKDFAAIPGMFALFGAVFRILRDEANHERRIVRDELKHARQIIRDEAEHNRTLLRDQAQQERQADLHRKQEMFGLGATSHMAMVAFDKHVEFCEEYLAEMDRTIVTLFREGPSATSLEHCTKLSAIRRNYATWVTTDISSVLDPFEAALKRIGANSQYVKDTRETGDAHRSEAIDEMFREFEKVMGAFVRKGDPDPERDCDIVMQKMRSILGIEELTQIRRKLISRVLLTPD